MSMIKVTEREEMPVTWSDICKDRNLEARTNNHVKRRGFRIHTPWKIEIINVIYICYTYI